MRQARAEERDRGKVSRSPIAQDCAPTGIGGAPTISCEGTRRRIHLVEGHPGAGKTTLGLQFLREGVRRGESCTVHHAVGDCGRASRQRGISRMGLSGIHLQELQPAENLVPRNSTRSFIHRKSSSGDLSRNVFEAVETFKPARAVLDSVSDMRLLARDSLRYRRQILGLKQFFVGRGCTLLLLNENGVS